MPRNLGLILDLLDRSLAALTGVFSTLQWGGRAYKVSGPNGSLKKPKLVAFVSIDRDGTAVEISFKLTREQQAACIEAHDFVRRNSFGSLGKAGWVEARVTTRRQVESLKAWLALSRRQYAGGVVAANTVGKASGSKQAASSQHTSPVAARIARVMTEVQNNLGWRPRCEDDEPGFTIGPAAKRRSPNRRSSPR